MVRLSKKQLRDKVAYAYHYMEPGNNATKSLMDSNANVSNKNVSTLAAEMNKDIDVQVNRFALAQRIKTLFGKKVMKQFYKSLKNHEIYSHDESAIFSKPYCCAIDLHPFIENGMIPLGGDSKAPQHLASFCGSYINLIFAISSQFAGAVADVSFLGYFHYFAKKDFGATYLETNKTEVENAFQHIFYSLNQPAAARGYQSVFYNTSIFDKNYFDALFSQMLMPNGETLDWEGVNSLQHFFMKWFNAERTKALLTFPVITAAYLTENGKPKDEAFKKFLAQEMAEGNSFFHYNSDSVDSLASCCRLRNAIDKNQFAYTLGGTGIATGSKKVFSLNINRMVQDGRDILTEVSNLHKYLIAYDTILHDMQSKGMLPVYDAGYISLDKQYLTIGVNGVVEAAEYLGMDISYNPTYIKWLQELFGTILKGNAFGGEFYSQMLGRKIKFNTELVPAENLGHKFAQWDRKAKYVVPRDVYNSYLYRVEDNQLDFIDKLKIHGKEVLQFLDGGSACHLNFTEIPSAESWEKVIDLAAFYGCNYWTWNVRSTICNECGYISKFDRQVCEKCGSADVDWATRIIGYLKRITSFSEARQKEAGYRFYERP